MSNLSRFPRKIATKTKKATQKATNLIQNRFAHLGENMSQHDRVAFESQWLYRQASGIECK